MAMNRYSFCYLITLLFIITISTGCGETGIGNGQACTLIGCDDGITIQLSDERPDSLSLTVYTDDTSEAIDSILCTHQDTSCFIRLGGLTPETVAVEIEWNSGAFRETFTPKYESFQPNGAGCPPVCSIATVDINLSGI